MPDDTTPPDAGEGDFVQFHKAGARVAGAFRCVDCGYGVTIHAQLPRCPMCAGTTWEAVAATPPIVRQML